jgi:hypothetical protein
MNQIDLVTFAEHSAKLPEQFLTPGKNADKNHTLKLLSAHMMDFFAIVTIIGMTSAMFAHGVEFFMVTRGLKAALPASLAVTFMSTFVPFSIFNYYFFSYFMNHGQTWGMFMMKKRIDLRNKSFLDSMKWAAYSTLLCLSGGMTYAFMKTKWDVFKSHDHLYHELIAHKEDYSMNILNIAEDQANDVPPEIEEWQRAA